MPRSFTNCHFSETPQTPPETAQRLVARLVYNPANYVPLTDGCAVSFRLERSWTPMKDLLRVVFFSVVPSLAIAPQAGATFRDPGLQSPG